MAVGGIGELQPEDFGIFLAAGNRSRRFVISFCLDNGDGEVTGISKEIIGPFLGTAILADTNDNPSIGESLLSVKECGSLSHPASTSLGRTYLRQVSASVIIRGVISPIQPCSSIQLLTAIQLLFDFTSKSCN